MVSWLEVGVSSLEMSMECGVVSLYGLCRSESLGKRGGVVVKWGLSFGAEVWGKEVERWKEKVGLVVAQAMVSNVFVYVCTYVCVCVCVAPVSLSFAGEVYERE